MAAIQIPKSKSITFNEYLYDIINNTTSSFATGWGFFVSIDEEPTQIKKQIFQNNYILKPRSQVIVRKNSIKSFPSTLNLHSPSLQNIDEISETIFEMDLSDVEPKCNNNYIVSNRNYDIPTNIYNNITTNIYFIGTIILYGSATCIKTLLES